MAIKKLRNRIGSYLKNRYRGAIESELRESNYVIPKEVITYSNDLLYTYHNADFIKTPRFEQVYKEVKEIGGHLLDNYDIQWRIHVITWFANHVKHLDGDFVDCGVNTGFCPMAVIRYTEFEKLKKKYFLFDTFYGMDERFSSPQEMDRHKKLGYGKNDELYKEVEERFSPWDVEIVKGAIPETLTKPDIKQVAYLSVDMNAVLPEIEALNFFWDKMVRGGVIVLDDYGYPGSEAQKKAHDEFARSKGVEVMSLPTCQGVIMKPW